MSARRSEAGDLTRPPRARADVDARTATRSSALVWLVRHAPTSDNLDGVVMGWRDPAATGDGLRDAAELLEGVPFELAVSSDARRARATASAIAPTVRLRLDARLRERGLGDWEGQRKRALRAAHRSAFTAAGSVRLDANPPGAEPLDALLARVHGALSDLAACAGPVLVVAHNGSLRAALVLLGAIDLATATTMTVDHLRPVAADLGDLRPPSAA